MYYIHKYEVSLTFGGAEEGGWWYKAGSPVEDWSPVFVEDEEVAFEVCRALNAAEKKRQDEEEDYDYTSVLSYKSQHFDYDVSESSVAEAFPKARPHYE